MRVWRMVVEVPGPEVWAFVAAAPDAVTAWRVVRAGLPRRVARAASLEEVSAAGGRLFGRPRLIRSWRLAPSQRRDSPSDEAPAVA